MFFFEPVISYTDVIFCSVQTRLLLLLILPPLFILHLHSPLSPPPSPSFPLPFSPSLPPPLLLSRYISLRTELLELHHNILEIEYSIIICNNNNNTEIIIIYVPIPTYFTTCYRRALAIHSRFFVGKKKSP